MNGFRAIGLPVSESLTERLGWVLVHSLWQFTLIALLAGILLRLMQRNSSEARSGVLIGLLVLSLGVPLATWKIQSGPGPFSNTDPARSVDFADGTLELHRNGQAATNNPLPLVDDHAGLSTEESGNVTTSTNEVAGVTRSISQRSNDTLSLSTWTSLATATVRPWLSWAVSFWGLGVILCSVRPLTGFVMLRRLKRVGVSPVSTEVLELLADAKERLGLRCTVQVFQSTVARVPLVAGYLRPVILLPASLITSIPATQLDAILTHELAHIRRHDFVVNVLQILIETLLFYHPSVWWLSNRIRIEREHCCDDLVVNVTNNRQEYGHALIAIEELRGRGSVLALGVSDGSLLARIRRITGQPDERSGLSIGATLALVISLSAILLGVNHASEHAADAANGAESAGVSETAGQADASGEGDAADVDRNTAADRTHAPEKDTGVDEPLPAGSTLRFGTSRLRLGIPISNITIADDGSLAVAANDNNVARTSRVFDLDSGHGLYSMRFVEAAAIHPDGQVIVTKERDFILRIREATTGRELRKIQLPRPNSSYSMNEWVTFTPDGKAIAVTSQGKIVHLIDFESGEMIRGFSNDNPESKLSASFQTVLGIAISADGTMMASGGFANDQGTYFACLWEVETGKELRRFAHTNRSYGIRSLAFSPDARLLATRSHDGCLRLFDVASGELLRTFEKDGGGRKPGTVAFSPDSRTVAAAGDSIRLFDVTTGEERLRINAHQAVSLRFMDDGKTLAAAHDGSVCRWDAVTGKLLSPEPGYSVVAQILVTPDSRRVVTRGGYYGDVHIWDGANGEHLDKFNAAAWDQDVAMSPDGRFLAFAILDTSIRFREAEPGNSPSYGWRILLYDIAAGKLVDRFPPFRGDAADLVFSDDGSDLITIGHRDGVVRVWDFETAKVERSIQVVPEAERYQHRQITQAVLSPNGRRLAVAYTPLHPPVAKGDSLSRGLMRSTPRPVRLWNVDTGEEIRELKDASAVMAFSPDGRHLVTSRGIVLDASTGERVTELPVAPHISALAFSQDSRSLAVAGPENVIEVRDVASWETVQTFEGLDRVTSLAFTPDGRLLSGSADTTVLAWKVNRVESR